MSQRVIIAVGDPVEAGSLQEIIKSICDPGILYGFELNAAAGGVLNITAGAAITDSGILIVESEERSLLLNLTVSPANYTVLYSYTPTNNFGGNPAVLSLQSGLINPEDFENGVILGWIKYPGNSVQLDPSSMFISAPRFRLGESIQKSSSEYEMFYAPFSPKWSLYSVSGPSLNTIEAWDSGYKAPITRVSNAGGAISRSKYLVPFRVPYYGLGKVQVEIQADGGSNVTVDLMDSLGNIITPPEVNFFTNCPMTKRVLSIPYSAGFTTNSEAFIMISFDIQPTFSARIKSLGVSSYTEPF